MTENQQVNQELDMCAMQTVAREPCLFFIIISNLLSSISRFLAWNNDCQINEELVSYLLVATK